MRKLKKYAAGFLMAITVSTGLVPQTMAAAMPAAAESAANPTTIAELRLQDQGPDLSRGRLVSEVWGMEEDGTPYVERLYVKELRSQTSYSNSKDYGARGSIDVWATFDYDGRVAGVMTSGGRYNTDTASKLSSQKTTNSVNSSRTKATATYSCTVSNYLSNTKYSVSISCDKDGNPS